MENLTQILKKQSEKEEPPTQGQERERIRELILEYDGNEKRLTGRTPEEVAKVAGFEKEKLFPPGKRVLYVGDPWQKLGKEMNDPNLTIIDYEFGESVSFLKDEKEFREDILEKAERLLKEIAVIKQNNSLSAQEIVRTDEFAGLIERAARLSQKAGYFTKGENPSEKYSEAAVAWERAKRYIEEIARTKKEGNQRLAMFAKNSWYDCVLGERGFRDIPDWHNIIFPRLESLIGEKEKTNGEKLSAGEINALVEKYQKQYIDDIRLKKQVEKPNVVKAMFPFLPFKDKTFDRFVSCWAISTHVFSEMETEDFEYYWREIIRVLDEDGEAFIFPINYGIVDENNLKQSLRNASNDRGMLFEWDFINTATLRLKRKKEK
ncbi:MAG: hypothetical protein CO002_01285 [Candidatus Portnoybacteria bacterium CG_4_8_14_3_um_filter_44_10]|uniref:Methyltransferase type 11 domain-containing protein n=3 Tax=Candidatus Portnoyibacteriota TaxID=1817913 RepID=A0A2M7IGD2_9BACT|nr:MAG: hypothetical protein CO002_01285 [Candidatus Portnoybacteria bacterium CG_4_8_14_3_um_filter_44_10]